MTKYAAIPGLSHGWPSSRLRRGWGPGDLSPIALLIVLGGGLSIGCQSPSKSADPAEFKAVRAALLATQEQTRKLESDLKALEVKVERLTRTPSASGRTIAGAAGHTPQPTELQVGDGAEKSAMSNAAVKADPVTRIGSWRWQRIDSFREANNLSHEQASTLVDLVQSERIALRVLAKSSKGQPPQEIEQKARRVKTVTDAKVAAQLGDAMGEKWRAFRASRWGKRR